MQPLLPNSPGDPPPRVFPTLPIVTPDPPRRSQREKYGSLLYLGLAGLVVIAALVAWFSWGVWSHRQVWLNVYVLHDRNRPESERIVAAYALSHDPRVNQRQLWDMCLREPLPPLARYVLAEALTAEAASADPRNYALTVARSTGWPDWLRLLLVRPIAYAAAEGVKFPPEPLDELRRHPDPSIGLWATAALALMEPDGSLTGTLDQACKQDATTRDLACLLVRAVHDRDHPEKAKADLDSATTWVREHHPGASDLWSGSGWEIRKGQLVHRPIPEARTIPPR